MKKYYTLSLLLIISLFSICQTNHVVNTVANSFNPSNLTIAVGDTVTWLPTTRGHNVEMVASPNNLKFKSKNSKEAKITFEKPGIYYYWCTPHKSMGMIGLVIVGNDLSNLADIKKAKAKGKSKKKLKSLLKSLG